MPSRYHPYSSTAFNSARSASRRRTSGSVGQTTTWSKDVVCIPRASRTQNFHYSDRDDSKDSKWHSRQSFLARLYQSYSHLPHKNTCYTRILDRAFNQSEKDKPIGPAKCPVYLKLPWIGQISETFGQSIKLITEQTFFVTRFVGIFSTKTILPPTHKECLPASSSSCVVYNLNANVDLPVWVDLIRDWVIGSNNMLLVSLEIKLSHHVHNQNDNAVSVNSSVVIQLLADTCLTSLVPKPTKTIILEFFTNAVPPFD